MFFRRNGYLGIFKVNSLLTNCGDNSDGKVERARELPLPPGAVRLRLEDHPLNLPVVILGEAVPLLQLVQLLLQRLFLWTLTVRLQRVKDGGSYEQVENNGEDETEGPDVLRLHPQRRSARGAEGGRAPLLGGTDAQRIKGASSMDSMHLQRDDALRPLWPARVTKKNE